MDEIQNLEELLKVKSDSEFHDLLIFLALGCVVPKKLHSPQFLQTIIKIQTESQVWISYQSIQATLQQIYGNIPIPRIFQGKAIQPDLIFSRAYWDKTLTPLWIKSTFSPEELEIDFPWIGPFQIKNLFEQRLQPDQKRFVQKGAFYSPQAEIQFLIRRTFKKYEQNKNNVQITSEDQKIRILDPACGCGDFLVGVVSYLAKFPHIHGLDVVLYGMDINERAIILTEFRIWANYLFQIFGNPNEAQQKRNISSVHEQFLHLFHDQHKFKHGDFLFETERLGEGTTAVPSFNIIIGNPPYIRYRDIMDPYQTDSNAHQSYRERLIQSVQQIPNIPRDFDTQCDYYIYFYLVSLQHLKSTGILGFIVSNSWMNVGFGGPFQEYLLHNACIHEIHDNLRRSFAKAEINTVITLFGKESQNMVTKDPILFVKWKWYFHEINDSDIPQLEEFFDANPKIPNKQQEIKQIPQMQIEICENQYARIVRLRDSTIFSISHILYPESTRYQGFNWANYFLLAPPFFFQILAELGTKYVMLRDIAEIRRGITTNCNDYFVLSKRDANQYENGYGEKMKLESEVLIPFLNSPRQLSSPIFHPTNIDTVLFYTDYSKQELQTQNYVNALQYIRYGESKPIEIKKGTAKGQNLIGIHQLASFRERFIKDPMRWYCLKRPNSRNTIETFKIFIEKIFDTTIKIGYSETPIMVNNTFYEIYLKPSYRGQEHFIFGLLLGSLTYLCMELHGRTNFGGGALDTATFDIEKIIIPNPALFNRDTLYEFFARVKPLMNRAFLPANEEVQQTDRKAFDEMLGKIGHLDFDFSQLYSAIIQIQKFRVSKANSL